MPYPSEHLSEWTLEMVAEGILPPGEQDAADRHLHGCLRCTAEIEAYRSLFESLGELPRFEPSAAFDDAVMARVRVAPRGSFSLGWLQKRLPTTSRGWTLLVAAALLPALPVLALLFWVLSHPVLTPELLAQWGIIRAREAAWATLAEAGGWVLDIGLLDWGERAWAAVSAVPTDLLSVVLIVTAVAIPLSAWSLVRLLRTPAGETAHA